MDRLAGTLEDLRRVVQRPIGKAVMVGLFFAWRVLPSSPVGEGICRERTAGLMCLDAAFMEMIGRLRMSGCHAARCRGAAGASCFLMPCAVAPAGGFAETEPLFSMPDAFTRAGGLRILGVFGPVLTCVAKVAVVVVDPVSLSVGALAAAFLAKAVEKAGEEAAGNIPAVLRRIRDWLREQFSRHDEEGAAALAKVEAVSDSPSRVKALAEAIDRRAAADDAFKAGLQDLIDQAKTAEGVDMKSVIQIAEGTGIVQVADIHGSTVSVTYGASPAPPTGSQPPETSNG